MRPFLLAQSSRAPARRLTSKWLDLQIPAALLDPAKRLNKLLSLLVTLYNAPINEREHVPFERQRHEVGEARRQVARATSTTPHRLEHAQRTYAAAEAAFAARLSTANDARVVRLQQVKAAFSLLHDSAALVPGFDDEAHGVALEVYVSRLDPGQQHAAVARVRDFVFAACEERAVRGEALDPNPPVRRSSSLSLFPCLRSVSSCAREHDADDDLALLAARSSSRSSTRCTLTTSATRSAPPA